MQEITTFITTSPSPVHPSTEQIDHVITSVRHFLPDSPIIIAADGVRLEQYYLRKQYEEYLENIKKNIAGGRYGDCLFIEAHEHMHQTGLLRNTLPEVKTKYMFWIEHDTPLLTNRKIDFNNILKALDKCDFIEFFHLPEIPKGWEHMMLGELDVDGTRYLKTSHWSSRTNIATKDYYAKCLSYYSSIAKAMFESLLYQKVVNAYTQKDLELMKQHRILIYAPENNLMYGGHDDGRKNEPTFNELQTF